MADDRKLLRYVPSFYPKTYKPFQDHRNTSLSKITETHVKHASISKITKTHVQCQYWQIDVNVSGTDNKKKKLRSTIPDSRRLNSKP
jgi:hypothetical protein